MLSASLDFPWEIEIICERAKKNWKFSIGQKPVFECQTLWRGDIAMFLKGILAKKNTTTCK